MKARLVGLAFASFAVYLLFAGELLAAEAATAGRHRVFSGSLVLSETYDDNILGYSADDLRLMAVDPQPAKFGIRSPGDFRTSVDLRADFAPTLFNSDPTRLRFSFGADLFARNPLENYETYGLALKQNFWRKNYLQIGSRHIPHFYLRNLWFSDSTLLRHEYLEAVFARQSYFCEVGRAFSRYFSVSLGYRHEKTDFNSEFDERDTIANAFLGDVSLGTRKAVAMHLGYTHKGSRAEGRNMAPAKEDVSNKTDRVSLGLDFGLLQDRGSPLSFAPLFVFEHQTYTTSRISDKYHYGRRDDYYRISSELSYRWNREVEQSLRYSYEWNRTNIGETLDAGNYEANKASLGFTFFF